MSITKLWTKNFLIITLANFFVYFTYYLLIAIIAVYATDQFHASPSVAGLSSGIFILGAILGRLYAGSSIDRVGHKKMLYFGFAFYLGSTLLYFAVNSLVLLIIVRILHGAAFGMTSTATGAIAAEIIPNERRGEGTGYYALSTTLAAAIGPFLGMFLTQHANFSASIIVCAIALGLSFLAAVPLTIPKIELIASECGNVKKFALSSFLEVKALPIAMITALCCFAYSSVLSFLSSYTKSVNLFEIGSFFFVAYAAAIIFSRPFTGLLFDKKGENFVVYPTLFLFMAGLIILGEAHSGYSILLAGVFIGFGYGNYFASGQALAVKVSPQNHRALATSTYFMSADLGAGFGPFILGFLIPMSGYNNLYFSMAAVVLATGVLYYFFHGRNRPKHQKETLF